MSTVLFDPEVIDIRAWDWAAQAACQDMPESVFFPPGDGDLSVEPAYPTPEAERLCAGCPVRTACLAWATRTGAEGTWAGTTSYQRRLLERTLHRAACPGCGSRAVEPARGSEVCLSCGLSWLV